MEKKILIAEDEEAIAKVLAKKLGLAGFQIVNAYDGEQALREIAQQKFDLILLDLLMPRVDGFAVLAELKGQKSEIPVIVSTNLNQANDVSRVFELGCYNYYVKADTTLDQIVENIKNVLKMH